MKRTIIAAAWALLLAAPAARGASGDWNVYLNTSAVNRITAIGDSLWCGTRGGIVLFNLADSTFSQRCDGLGFRSTNVTDVAVDGAGAVWASFMTSGVARIDRFGADPIVKLYSVIDGILSDSVTCIAAAGSDVYYGSSRGAAKFFENLPSWEPILSDSLDGVRVSDILARDDTIYAATDRGVARFNRATFEYRLYRIGKGLSLCVSGGAVHAATITGVHRFNGSGWTSLGLPGGAQPFAVAGGSGALYAITDGRAHRYDGSTWIELGTDNMRAVFSQNYKIFSNYNIPRTIAVDSRGTLWLAGYEPQLNRGAYVNRWTGSSWVTRAPVELTQNNVVGISIAPEGTWVSAQQYGVCLLRENGSWIQYTKMRSSGDPAGWSYWAFMLCFLRDTQGYLWAAVPGVALDRLRVNDPGSAADDEWAHYALGEGTITTNRFIKAREDPAGNRWFLSDDVVPGMSGINILSADGQHWLSVNPSVEPRMAGGSVFDVSFSPNGAAHLALRGYGLQSWTTGGFDWASLSNLADDGWFSPIEPTDLASTIIYSCERGPDGALWLGTAAGLIRYRDGVIDSFTVKTAAGSDGLLGAQVNDLEFDAEGNLWVATDGGLNRIDPDDGILAFTAWEAWDGNLYPASSICPLPSAVCQTLACDASANVLWIGTAGGLARLDVSPAASVRLPLSRAILYPNPVHLGRGDSRVRISRISAPVSIRVYNLEGELVHEVDGVADGGTAWDLLTLNGYKATSGVYLVRVSDGRSVETRKIAVVR